MKLHVNLYLNSKDSVIVISIFRTKTVLLIIQKKANSFFFMKNPETEVNIGIEFAIKLDPAYY